MCILIWMKSGCGISPSFFFLTNERVHSTNLFIHDLWSLKPPLCSGNQEEHGTIYYTPSEKAKQKGGPHQAFFRASRP